MPIVPFTIFQPFKRLHIAIFTKKDDIGSDATAGERMGFTKTAGLQQMHGSLTVRMDGPCDRTAQADGMITATKDLLLCTRWADCQNFVVYAPEQNVCGVLHAGWKGLIAGAVPSLFATLESACGVRPEDVLIGAGPSLCKRCADFSDPATELPNIPPEFIDGRHVDLQGYATMQLMDIGVAPDRFERHPDCTRCRPEQYWTYRGGDREAVQAKHTNMLCCGLHP